LNLIFFLFTEFDYLQYLTFWFYIKKNLVF